MPATQLFRPVPVFAAAILMRLVLMAWGRYQDTHTPVKYTDIDYLVFTDAARYVSHGQSPYARETYRYTPLLAWLLYPTTFSPAYIWFDFGKLLFAIGDIVTGYMLYRILITGVDRQTGESANGKAGMSSQKALMYACIWLLNPMVAAISTRGSSEALLIVIVTALLWSVLCRKIVLAGMLLGLGVHFKIYPFIYAASIFWHLGPRELQNDDKRHGPLVQWLRRQVTTERVQLCIYSFTTFMLLNVLMYAIYGHPFLEHSYLYHITRIDHRHNFSVYNTLLHLKSAVGPQSGFAIESLAFLPQIALTVILLPLLSISTSNLAGTMLAQTLAFVTFNKVCTSQYFLWYMVFLPLHLPRSQLVGYPKLGIIAVVTWAAAQGVWLQKAYQLEFLGYSTFVPGLWVASILFFAVNCWLLGIVVMDLGQEHAGTVVVEAKAKAS